MQDNNMQNVTLAECRRAIYEQFAALKNGKISIDEALASSKLMHQIINSYDVEVKAIEAATRAINAGIATDIEGMTLITIKD